MAGCEHRTLFHRRADELSRRSGHPVLVWETFEDLLPYALGPGARASGCGWRLLGEVTLVLGQQPADSPLLSDVVDWLQRCGVGQERAELVVWRWSRQQPNLPWLLEQFRQVVDQYGSQSAATGFFDRVQDCPLPESCPRLGEPVMAAAWYWCRLYLLALDDDALTLLCEES